VIFQDVERHARERPDAVALVSGADRRRYCALVADANRLARGLIERGIHPGDAVALQLGNTPAFVIALLGLARLGAVAVLLDDELKKSEVEAAMASAGARRLLASDTFSEMAAIDRDSQVPVLPPMPPPHAPWLCQFTSGTTGAPTPVVRTHAQVAFALEAFASAIGTTDRDCFLAAIPLTHGYGLFNACLGALHAGGTIVLQPRFDRRETLRLIARERVTVFPAVPFMWAILAETRMPTPVDLSSVRWPLTGGARLDARTWRVVRDRLGLQLRQMYGTTETSVIAMNLDTDVESTLESVGRALPGIEIAIENGTVAVRSGSASRADADGWTRTGDVGRMDESGRLFLLGRATEIVRVAGRTINPAEIESVLASYPAVRDAAVITIRDPHGEPAIKAMVVAECTVGELVEFCQGRLAAYKMPRVIDLCASIPRGRTGKVLARDIVPLSIDD